MIHPVCTFKMKFVRQAEGGGGGASAPLSAAAVTGGVGDDRLTGTSGNDVFYDGNGDDRMLGGSGDDTFHITQNPAQMSYEEVLGGTGNDTLVLSGDRADWSWEYVAGSNKVLVGHGGGVSEPIYETEVYSLGQYRFTNGTTYLDVMDVETVSFTDSGADLSLAHVDDTVDNSSTFERSSQGAVIADRYNSDHAANGQWTGSNVDDVFVALGQNVSGDGDVWKWDKAPGNETFYGLSGNDNIGGGRGNDSLYGGSGADTLYGHTGDDSLGGGTGNDVLRGGVGRDKLTGGSGDDTLNGGYGNDSLGGGAGNDMLRGGFGSDKLSGLTGDDTLYGGNGNDMLSGGAGNDMLRGGMGRDKLTGAFGDDTLYGGYGDDTLNGGAYNDTFVFADGFGSDRINDFDALSSLEQIDFSGLGAIASFADLMANHATQSGDDVIIDDQEGNTLTLVQVDLADLDAGDFIF